MPVREELQYATCRQQKRLCTCNFELTAALGLLFSSTQNLAFVRLLRSEPVLMDTELLPTSAGVSYEGEIVYL